MQKRSRDMIIAITTLTIQKITTGLAELATLKGIVKGLYRRIMSEVVYNFSGET